MSASKIIICATQRSGSTLVCEDLRNNGLGLAEEHFLRVLGPNRPRDRAADLKIVEDAGRGPNGIYSVKVMSSYADRVNELLSAPESGANGTGGIWPGLHAHFQDAIWVYVTRRSAVRQAVSRLVAQHTGINHAVANSDAKFIPGKSQIGYVSSYNLNVQLHQAELAQHIVNIAVENHLWEKFFAEHDITPIRLVYEDFVDNPNYISAVRAAAGLPETSGLTTRHLMKLANDKSETLIEQFVDSWSADRGSIAKAPASPKPPLPKADELEQLKQATAVVTRRWAETPYYDSVEKRARSQWDHLISPFLADHPIDYSAVLELAVGHGRMTKILLEKARHVTGVDVLQENIDFCAERFDGVPNITLIRNDGLALNAVDDNSISFAFCFDSMVHFDSDVVRAYLGEFYRVLRPGGMAFCHHSNLTRNPDGNIRRSPHSRNFMSEALFRHLAGKKGLTVVKSQVIDWGTGERFVAGLDCLSLIRKAVS